MLDPKWLASVVWPDVFVSSSVSVLSFSFFSSLCITGTQQGYLYVWQLRSSKQQLCSSSSSSSSERSNSEGNRCSTQERDPVAAAAAAGLAAAAGQAPGCAAAAAAAATASSGGAATRAAAAAAAAAGESGCRSPLLLPHLVLLPEWGTAAAATAACFVAAPLAALQSTSQELLVSLHSDCRARLWSLSDGRCLLVRCSSS